MPYYKAKDKPYKSNRTDKADKADQEEILPEENAISKAKKLPTPEYINFLASLMCAIDEISIATGISENDLKLKYAEEISKGHNQAKINIRDALMMNIYSGNATFLKYLSEHYLGLGIESQDTNQTTDIGYISVCPTCKNIDMQKKTSTKINKDTNDVKQVRQ